MSVAWCFGLGLMGCCFALSLTSPSDWGSGEELRGMTGMGAGDVGLESVESASEPSVRRWNVARRLVMMVNSAER